MNRRYQVYYNLHSANKFRTVHRSKPSDNLAEVLELLPHISCEDDNIFVYVVDRMLRIMIGFDSDVEKCIFELHLADRGILCAKTVMRNDLVGYLDNIDSVLDHPEKYEFECESF